MPAVTHHTHWALFEHSTPRYYSLLQVKPQLQLRGEAEDMITSCASRKSRRRCLTATTKDSHNSNMAVTLALLMIALASSPASSLTLAASPPPSYPPPSSTALHSAIASSTASSALASSPSSAATTICVPPPNSRLAQLSTSLPGTKHKRSGRLSSIGHPLGRNLRYATYPPAEDAAEVVAPLFYHPPPRDDCDEPMDATSQIHSDHSARPRQPPTKRRRRVRMLRSVDRPAFAATSSSRRTKSRRHPPKLHVNDDGDDDTDEEEDQLLLHEYKQRKAAWAAKYTSVTTLRSTFGTNKNRIWGDFDPVATRRLYHTLLPRALLELRGLRDMMLENNHTARTTGTSDCTGTATNGKRKSFFSSSNSNSSNSSNNKSNFGDIASSSSSSSSDLIIKQELKELAPLAYQARVAAKKYARERSRLPGRIGSMLYDGYRQWRKYGKWDNSGMSWEQIWNKYEDQVLSEVMEETSRDADVEDEEDEVIVTYGNYLDDEELTARICLRILERSVVTNEMVDRLFRRTHHDSNSSSSEGGSLHGTKLRKRRHEHRKNLILKDLQAIEKKFDDDIQELLRYSKFTTKEGEERRRKRKKGAFFWKKPRLSSTPSLSSSSSSSDVDDETDNKDNDPNPTSCVLDVLTSARGGELLDDISSSFNSSTSSSSSESTVHATAKNNQKKKKPSSRKLATHEVTALRILATTKQRIASLQAMKDMMKVTSETSSS